jgi:hypothetical protein
MKLRVFSGIFLLVLIFSVSVVLADTGKVSLNERTGFLQAHQQRVVVTMITVVDNDILLYDDTGRQVVCFNPAAVSFFFKKEEGKLWMIIQVRGNNTTSEEAEKDQLKFEVKFMED